MKASRARILTSNKFSRILYHFIRAYSVTFRLRVENEKCWMRHIEEGGRVLLCTWHQQFFSFIRYFRKYRHYGPSLMISQSNDGEMISRIANLTGWHTVRGSSSKGGKEGLLEMIKRLKHTGLAAHIVDGPRGPAGVVKRGVIQLAHDAEAVIVPVYAVAENAWYFNSWDRFLLPKPFSKVIIRYGEMIQIDRCEDVKHFESQRKGLEERMRPALQ